MTSRSRRPLGVTALVIAGAWLLAGCAGGPFPSPSPGELIDRAHEVADEALVAAATTALQALEASGRVSEEAVRSAIEKAGGDRVETRLTGDAVLFGARVADGCVSGSVGGGDPVTVELTAPNTDGGCLPAQ